MPRLELNRPLQVFLWCFAVVCIIITSLRVYQVDLWWQLPEGISILQTWHLPSQPPAAFGIPAQPYFDEYGLYEIVLALVYRLGGFIALWLIFMAVYLAIFFIPIASGPRRYLNFSVLSTLLLLLAAILLANRLEQRPDLVGTLFLVFLLHLLRQSKLETVNLCGFVKLGLLFCLWSNTHGSFVVGLGALGLWLLSEVFLKSSHGQGQKRAALVFLVALGGVFVNPYGGARLIFPFWEHADTGSTVLSAEMWPVAQQSSTIAALLIFAGVLMSAACFLRGRPPFWLGCFAFGTLVLATLNFRFVNLLAVSLIFLYAERQFTAPSPLTSTSRWSGAKTVFLLALCVPFFYLDAAWGTLIIRHQLEDIHGLQADRVFAPGLVAIIKDDPGSKKSVLCHLGEGAYLSFAGRGQVCPLMDSGLSRFSEETKHADFFIENEPRAFSAALKNIDVHYILVTRRVDWWALLLIHQPGWNLERCTEEGFLFRRTGEAKPLPLPPELKTQLATTRETFLENSAYVSAFCCSVLIDTPLESVTILDRSLSKNWSEPFFLAVDEWLDSLSLNDLDEIEVSLMKNGTGNSLLHEMVRTKLHPRQAGGPSAPLTSADNGWLEEMLHLQNLIDAGEADSARQEFDRITKPAFISTVYPDLWNQLRNATLPSEHPLTRYQQWQSWDRAAQEMFARTCVQLNGRLNGPR